MAGKRKPPRTLKAPTRDVSPAQAENFLQKAETHLESATEAAALERWDTAVLLAVHAGISAGDAVTIARFGLRSASQTHRDQVRLVRDLFPDDEEARKASNQLEALLERKNAVEYEARRCTAGDTRVAVKHAERIVAWARRVRTS